MLLLITAFLVLSVGGLAAWADAVAPAAPANLAATATSDTIIGLTWDANAEPDLGSYRIYRDAVLIVEVPGTATSYNNGALTAETLYSYTITAVDTFGNESDASVAATATTAAAAAGAFTFAVTDATNALPAQVGTTITSMSPVFMIPAGLIVGAAVLGWGIVMLKRFNAGGGKKKGHGHA